MLIWRAIIAVCLSLALVGGILAPARAEAQPTPKTYALVKRGETRMYSNYRDGYRLHIPLNWRLAEAGAYPATVFYTDKFKLEIRVDKDILARDTLDNYLANTWQPIRAGWGGVKALDYRETRSNEMPRYSLAWVRPAINDQDLYTRYYQVLVIKDKTVMSFFLKSAPADMAAARRQVDHAVNRLVFRTTRDVPPGKEPEPVGDLVLSRGGVDYRLAPGQAVLGIFQPGVPYYAEKLQDLQQLETDLGWKFDVVMSYYGFNESYAEHRAGIEAIYRDQRMLMLTLHPWDYTGDRNRPLVPEIIRGDWDEKITDWAKGVKSLPGTVLIRFANEMNGDWVSWSKIYYGQDHDLYIQAWRRVVELFRAAGADNALFVWNPNDISSPNYAWNDSASYYPGDDYVDVIGLSGYNFGGERWRDFDAIFAPVYAEYLKLYQDKPFMIAEFGSAESGGDKAQWIRTGMAGLTEKYPNIRLAVWFNKTDGPYRFPLNSSPSSLTAFQDVIKSQPWRRLQKILLTSGPNSAIVKSN